jgi:hypothetical protein
VSVYKSLAYSVGTGGLDRTQIGNALLGMNWIVRTQTFSAAGSFPKLAGDYFANWEVGMEGRAPALRRGASASGRKSGRKQVSAKRRTGVALTIVLSE